MEKRAFLSVRTAAELELQEPKRVTPNCSITSLEKVNFPIDDKQVHTKQVIRTKSEIWERKG